jgi:hypothetical protein
MLSSYLLEEKAGDYPEGHYELAVQTAAEAGHQEELDALFARRSLRETKRLALYLLAIVLILPLIFSLIKEERKDEGGGREQPQGLPGPADFTELDEQESRQLAEKLRGLLDHLGGGGATVGAMVPPPGSGVLHSCAALLADRGKERSPEALLQALDRRLGTPSPRREPGPLSEQGPAKRQLRLLLWKHDVAGYNKRELSPTELVERLQEKVLRGGSP